MAKVKIQGHASGTGVLTVTAPNTSTDRTITLPDSTGTLATTADVPSSITDNGDATAITIDSSERVGIGTTSPSGQLDIQTANGAGILKTTATTGTNACYGQFSNTGGGFIVGRDNSSGGILGGGVYASHLYSQGAYPLVFSTNSAKRMSIDSTGAVTMPSQPCVSARAMYTDIPINTVTVINLDNERFDVGNNLASNTFTAPVTGKYLYTYTLYFTNVDTAATSLGVQVVTSNRQYENWFAPDHIANTDFYYTATSSQVADMDANDTLQFKAYCGGGAAQTDIHADSQISIVLIA